MNSRKLFGTAIYAILALSASSSVIMGEDDPAAYQLITADGEDSPSSLSETADDQAQGAGCCNTDFCRSCWCPRWTASADFIILDRVGGANQTLVRGTIPRVGTNDLLDGDDFRQGMHGGPRLGLIRHGDLGYDLELLYFQIDGWSNSRTVYPNGQILSFDLPDFTALSTTDPIRFDYASKLYNAEFNVRWNPLCRVTVLAGFRWLELRENLEGAGVPSTLEYFWNTNTKNNLYGFQIGADADLWERGCFSIDGLAKFGIFGNHAEQSSALSTVQQSGIGSAATNHTSFLGEIALQCKCQVTQSLTLRAGYGAMWLQGIALAPGQIQEDYFNHDLFGINANNGVFYHGAVAGLEYSF
jgi:hypothetical protein